LLDDSRKRETQANDRQRHNEHQTQAGPKGRTCGRAPGIL
jgi:hypothetical protein